MADEPGVDEHYRSPTSLDIDEVALYTYRNPEDGTGDIDCMLQHLNTYWGLVQEMFPEAWDMPSRESRPTHGMGIQAMGFVMDHFTKDSNSSRFQMRLLMDSRG